MSPEFVSILTALKHSPAGESLRQTYRWSQFRVNESNKKWIELFGATGQVLTHSELFYNYARWMVKKEPGKFPYKKATKFLWGVALHDIGEAKIDGKGVGDISAFYKTAKDEKKEYAMARYAITLLDLPEKTKQKLIENYNLVVAGEDPQLNFAFKALEKSEYVFTTMKVFQNSLNLKARGRRGLKYLEPMVGRVLVFDLKKVLDVYAPEFPHSIGRAFRSGAPIIDKMYEYSLPWLQSHNEWMGKTYDHTKLAEDFSAKWNGFKNGDIISP